jgi:hypothetical protein
MNARPDDRTERVFLDEFQTLDTEPSRSASNGVPILDESIEITVTPSPAAVPVPIDAPDPTRRLVPLTLKQRFMVLQQLQAAADRARVYFDVEPVPIHAPTGVRVFSNHWRRLSKWLKAQDALTFRDVHVDMVIAPEFYDAAIALLKSVATTVPTMSHRAIAAGHVEYVHVAFREDS